MPQGNGPQANFCREPLSPRDNGANRNDLPQNNNAGYRNDNYPNYNGQQQNDPRAAFNNAAPPNFGGYQGTPQQGFPRTPDARNFDNYGNRYDYYYNNNNHGIPNPGNARPNPNGQPPPAQNRKNRRPEFLNRGYYNVNPDASQHGTNNSRAPDANNPQGQFNDFVRPGNPRPQQNNFASLAEDDRRAAAIIAAAMQHANAFRGPKPDSRPQGKQSYEEIKLIEHKISMLDVPPFKKDDVAYVDRIKAAIKSTGLDVKDEFTSHRLLTRITKCVPHELLNGASVKNLDELWEFLMEATVPFQTSEDVVKYYKDLCPTRPPGELFNLVLCALRGIDPDNSEAESEKVAWNTIRQNFYRGTTLGDHLYMIKRKPDKERFQELKLLWKSIYQLKKTDKQVHQISGQKDSDHSSNQVNWIRNKENKNGYGNKFSKPYAQQGNKWNNNDKKPYHKFHNNKNFQAQSGYKSQGLDAATAKAKLGCDEERFAQIVRDTKLICGNHAKFGDNCKCCCGYWCSWLKDKSKPTPGRILRTAHPFTLVKWDDRGPSNKNFVKNNNAHSVIKTLRS